MKWNLKRNKYKGYNVYSMKKYVDKKRILFAILTAILVALTLLLIALYSISNIKMLKNIQKQNEQLISLYNKFKEEEQLKQQKEQETWEQNNYNIEHVYSSDVNRVFLTFDDGPSDNTTEILKILQNYGIKANFFVLGSRAEIMPEKVKEIFSQGHFIGNHGYSHVYESIYSSPQAVVDEYNKTNEIIQKALGEYSFKAKLFRFPGGLVGGKYDEIKHQAKQLLEQNKILNVDWNALTGDSESSKPTAEKIMYNLQKTAGGKKSVVLLMHDSAAKKITVETLPQVIEYFKNQGYEFKTFNDILK